MSTNRRSLVANAALGTAFFAAGAASAASPAAPSAPARARGRPSLEVQIQQDIAARKCSNAMNRYEMYLAQSFLHEALDQFALTMPDVQADVGFGLYYGPDSVRRLFLDLHEELVGDARKGTQKPGAFYVVTNTSEIVEVAEDLKTAKGSWVGTTVSTLGDATSGWRPRLGYARRVADFVNVNGQWKIWHYGVYGLISAPLGKSYTDPEVYEANTTKPRVYTGRLAADAPSGPGLGAMGAWRPDRSHYAVMPPEPYRTFSETFSYALRP